VCLPKTHYGEDEDDHQWDQTVSRELQRDFNNTEGETLKGSVKETWKSVTGEETPCSEKSSSLNLV